MMTETWTEVCSMDALVEGEPIAMTVGDFHIALYRVGDAVFATDNACSHGSALLCDGFQEKFEIECPLHQGRFDIRDGRALCEPLTADIRAYPTKVEGNRVFLGQVP